MRPGSAPAPPVLGRARALPRPPARALPRPPARTGRGTCGGGAGRARRDGGTAPPAPQPLSGSPSPAAPAPQPPGSSPAAPGPQPRWAGAPGPTCARRSPLARSLSASRARPGWFPGSRRQTGRTGFPGSPGGEQGRGRSRRRLPIGDCPAAGGSRGRCCRDGPGSSGGPRSSASPGEGWGEALAITGTSLLALF